MGDLPTKVRGWTSLQWKIHISSLGEWEQLSPRLRSPKWAVLMEMKV